MTALGGADGAPGASIWKVIVTDYVSDGAADSGITNTSHINEKTFSLQKGESYAKRCWCCVNG